MSFKLFGGIVGVDQIHVVVPDEKDGDRTFVFDKLDGETHRRYFDLLIGRAGQRKGNAIKAVQYMFRQKCVDVLGLTEEEKKWLEDSNKTFKEIVLADSDYALLLDAVVGRYVNTAVIDTDSSKSS